MELKKIKYSESVGEPNEWVLHEMSFGSKTLLVGRNASGKSRTLSIIANLARHLAGQRGPSPSGSYECIFESFGSVYEYRLSFRAETVEFEELEVDGVIRLHRRGDGEGEIFAEQLNRGENMRFQVPSKSIAAVVRRDSVQHSFLEPLHRWASSLRFYQFGGQLGKDRYAIFTEDSASTVDESNQDAVVGIFAAGLAREPDSFKQSIISDMGKIGYSINDVGVGNPRHIKFKDAPGVPIGLYVQEDDLPGHTEQHEMSQGMFRVLSLLIHVNYAEMRKSGACFVVDDIGEGLDFGRSCRLIHLLRKKAEHSSVQVILSTNDKFIMNEIPLIEWSIVERKGNQVFIRNYENSKEIFDDFRFTGLSNFSFFELDVINNNESSTVLH